MFLLFLVAGPGVGGAGGQAPAGRGAGEDLRRGGREKISSEVLVHQRRKQRPPGLPRAEHAGNLRRTGLNPNNLDGEDCALYVRQRLTRQEIGRLRGQGVVTHDTYIPPVPGKHPAGFHLATIRYSSLDLIQSDPRFVRLESTEFLNKPLNDLAGVQTNVDDVHSGSGVTARTGAGVKIAIADSGVDLTHGDFPTPVETYDMTDGVDTSTWSTDVANTVTDHGTHVAASALGRGTLSGGQYIGAAP